MMVARILMLVGLVKILLITNKVILCAAVYAGLDLAVGAGILGPSWSLLGLGVIGWGPRLRLGARPSAAAARCLGGPAFGGRCAGFAPSRGRGLSGPFS